MIIEKPFIKHLLRNLASIILLSALVQACVQVPEEVDQTEAVFRVAMQPIVQTDPALISSDSEVLVANHVFDYLVDIDGKAGPYTVEARLLYQATQPAFVDGMHTDADRVNRFKVMYDDVPPTVEELATATSI